MPFEVLQDAQQLHEKLPFEKARNMLATLRVTEGQRN